MSHVTHNSASVQSTLLSWQQAQAILERCDAKGNPIPFAIVFCTADESAGTGGEFIYYPNAIWHVAGGRVNRSGQFKRAKATHNVPKRSPGSRWMRRIRAVDTDQVRQLHIHLILKINGQPVR